MHEHLTEFNLINMNGRVYDPLTAMFFSPDPYLQAPGNWLNYNRYGYCLNNPFLYTDPNGEFFLMAIFIGAVINTAIQGFSRNLGGQASFWKAMGIGALSGVAGYGAGSLVSGALSTATTLGGSIANGVAVGAASGFAGGFVGGAGNAWTNGASFGSGLKSGLIGGGLGALSGAVIGGVTGGLQYHKQMALFHKGNDVLGVDAEEAVPATDQFLLDAQFAWYPDAPMEYIDAFSVENLSTTAIAHFNANPEVSGITIPKSANGLLTGRSDVFFALKTFSSAKQLFFTMGHEFIHVSQFASLTGTSVSLVNNPLFGEMLEYHAYSYQNAIGGGTGMNSFRGSMRDMVTTYKDYFMQLHYTRFPWTSNVEFCYPF
jgi:RHS repeat-associated protein